MRIILASQSAGRKKIMDSLKIKYEVLPANIDEEKITASNPIQLVKKIAKAKAQAVAAKILQNMSFPRHACRQAGKRESSLIIAADSMVLFKGKTYGKPKTKTEAKQMLSMLSGQTHEFITGLCIIKVNSPGNIPVKLKPRIILKSCKSFITFEKFTKEEIENYVNIADVISFAGGFAPDLEAGEIIKRKMKIKGSISNVLGGLPLELLVPILIRTEGPATAA